MLMLTVNYFFFVGHNMTNICQTGDHLTNRIYNIQNIYNNNNNKIFFSTSKYARILKKSHFSIFFFP